jgi:choloylglycine hydrolase
MEVIMKKVLPGIISLISLIASLPSLACTDFMLTAKDGTLLITRSMEFGQNLNSNIRTSNRERAFTTTTPNNKPGLTWTAKYGYLYVDGFNVDATFDGMNEAGLTFEYLYLPGETQYQNIPEGKDSQVVPYANFGDWVLSNFQTVDEVKQALQNIIVSNQVIPQLGSAILPAHASIRDASGKGIVVEFYNDKINVYDNIGVMTNSPKYDWQVTNLRNYINLSPYNPEPIVADGITYSSTGQGTGAVGLPGDASPPSRFVKTAYMLKNVFPGQSAGDLVNMAQHIINNVDIPAGLVRSLDNGQTAVDTTQWVVFKDVTHKMFYYRTYNDMTLRAIDMSKINFAKTAVRLKMPMAGNPYMMNMTAPFTHSK